MNPRLKTFFTTTLPRDPLLTALVVPGQPLSRSGFLILLPFIFFLIRMVWSMVATPVLALPLTFWFWFVPITGRILHTGRKRTGTAVFLALILTLATAMTLQVILLSPDRIGPLLLDGNTTLRDSALGVLINRTAWATALIHALLGMASAVVITVLSIIPGLGESRHLFPSTSDNRMPFSLKGKTSRETLRLYSFGYAVLSGLMLLFYILIIIMLEGPTDFAEGSWIGSENTGFFTGLAIVNATLFTVMLLSTATLYARRLRETGRSGLWTLLILPVILGGSLIHPHHLYLLLPFISSRMGMIHLMFSTIWLGPVLYPLVISLNTVALLLLGYLYLAPPAPRRETVPLPQPETEE